MRKLDRSQYQKGMHLIGDKYPGTFGGMYRAPVERPRPVERKPASPAVDPALVYLQKRTAELTALKEKFDWSRSRSRRFERR